MSENDALKSETQVETIDPRVPKACKAHGIDGRYLLASSVDPSGTVTLVTHGGKRVRWREGDKPEPLSAIEITGINPDAAKRKVIAGKAK